MSHGKPTSNTHKGQGRYSGELISDMVTRRVFVFCHVQRKPVINEVYDHQICMGTTTVHTHIVSLHTKSDVTTRVERGERQKKETATACMAISAQRMRLKPRHKSIISGLKVLSTSFINS